MKQINVKLSAKGIDDAIKQLEKYRDSIEPKAKRVCHKLAVEPIPMVDSQYLAAAAESGNTRGWFFHVNDVENGTNLMVVGHDVAFLEFGAGLTAGEDYPDKYKGGVDTSPGSWAQSELGKGIFHPTDHPYWNYKGTEYTHITPSKGMYYASRYAERRAENELREAFK